MNAQQPAPELTSRLKKMKRQPFGSNEAGDPIEEISAQLVISPINYMLDAVGERAEGSDSGALRDAALQRLVRIQQRSRLMRLSPFKRMQPGSPKS